MPVISERLEADLAAIFAERMRTDRVERKLYSADIGDMPRLVKPFVPAGIAGAVVRPSTEAQIVELMALARRDGVRLVPRGASTSGYGGVLPVEGAVVVDLSGMHDVLEVDVAGQSVRVQPGVIWEELERRIARDGLALRLYPSSTPSSSVAGWLAQGGAGFGSYEYGMFKDNVASARVVLPTGVVREFSGEDLARYVADAEGITGIITEVRVMLRELEPEVHRVIAFPDAASIHAALSDISGSRLPIWSITFLNPESTRLKKRLPHRHGHPYEEAHHDFDPELPEAYLAVIAYPESRRVAIDDGLARIVEARRGVELPTATAEHEWDQRFAPMRLKRVGPSIIPTEVVVPLSELEGVLDEIGEKVRQPFVLEGMVGKGDRVVLLGFIPHDSRTFAFNAAFALSLTVIGIARRHGGSAYSTGLYFRRHAHSVLGAERVRRLAEFKRSVDPAGLMNPNKVLESGAVDALMGVASALEPAIRPLANAFRPPATVKLAARRGVPADVGYFSYACAQCGYCVHTCEEYSGRGWMSHSPRGKYLYLREVMEGRERFDQRMVDTFLVCTTCEVCNTRCQLQLPVEHSWMEMRGEMVQKQTFGTLGTFPPFEMMAASLRGERDIWAAKAEHRADWVPDDLVKPLAETGPIMYFAGCTASFVNTDVAEASVRLLTDAGYELSYMGEQEACCGIPMKVAGKWDLFEEIYEHNTTAARERGATTIVTSCPACALVWKELYPAVAAERGDAYEFDVKHYSELLAPAIADGRLSLDDSAPSCTVTFHDSCHMGRAQGVYEPPRDMLRAMPGVELVEMEHHHEEGLCCGSVLTLVGEKAVAPVLGGTRLREAVDAGADTVVALCPCCQVQLRDSALKNGIDIKVTDLARFVAGAAGHAIEDKTDYSNYMWRFFDRFIDLMRPEEMAGVMAEIFPQMMDAMPFGMKPMMKSMKYVPGGLAVMRLAMPVMFPMLVDGIMAKVMPDMIAAVRGRIGTMPEDMDALIDDLLPETMAALMPSYLPQLIPYVTPRMIDYIGTDM